jgi:YidC/Oxa1 family membrane protein insertase
MAPFVSANVIQDAFSPLISVFKAIMVFLHDNVTGGSWGLAIIGLTIVVRAALVPLTVKQFSSMAKLQALGPDIKALQARHKDDKQRLNEEMMKFYKENQVNPLGSCLPLIAQFPVFIALFYMLRSDLRKNICPQVQPGAKLVHGHWVFASGAHTQACGPHAPGAGFLFVHDLTNKATGGELIALIVLYVGTQLGSSLMMMSTSASMDKMQRNLMLFMPLIFVFIMIGFPAGVLIYWITTNSWTILQQYIVKRRIGPPPAVVAAAAAGGTGGGGSSGGGRGAGGRGGGNGSGGGGNGLPGGSEGEGGLAGMLKSRLKPASPDKEPARVAPRGGPPPRSPRKKKKRSGRRR